MLRSRGTCSSVIFLRSNAEVHFTRNRLRHVLLPLLREQFNPKVSDALRRLASAAAEADEFLAAEASAGLGEILREEGTGADRAIIVDVSHLRSLKAAIQSYILGEALARAGCPGEALHIEQMRALALSP